MCIVQFNRRREVIVNMIHYSRRSKVLNLHCQITVTSRNACAACRLAKCLEQGMQVELIRGRNPTPIKRTKNKIVQLIQTVKVSEGTRREQ